MLDALAGAPVRLLIHGDAPAWLAGMPNAECIPGDILDASSLDSVLNGVDTVVNLAGQVSEHVEDYQTVNLRGAIELAHACSRHQVRRLIHASSALVYGDAVNATEMDPCRPITPYATMKLAAEEILRGSLRRTELLCLRLSNVYGANQTKGLMPYLLGCLRERKRITIDADGAQIRDFVHVRDVAAALAVAMERPACGVLNIGSGVPTSVIGLLRLLEDLLDIPATGQYCPEHSGGERRSTVCVARAADALGWRACVALRDGV
ncbi:MAG TPA: NAD-dependent epimerase/dehydratase family protein, partial [Nitrospirales bacterium]|nr:NAD-dependent epimerase/dehydratase family protein [Nitrospirales bacterium]